MSGASTEVDQPTVDQTDVDGGGERSIRRRIIVVGMVFLVAALVIERLSAMRHYRHIDGPLVLPISSSLGVHLTDLLVLAAVVTFAWFVTGLMAGSAVPVESESPSDDPVLSEPSPEKAEDVPSPDEERSGGRLRRKLSAGLVDASLASAATLLCGLYAARYFDAVDLGIYGLFFSAFVVAAIVPAQLVCAPVEVEVLGWNVREQMGSLRQTVPAAISVGAVATVVVFGVVVASSAPFDERAVYPIAITGFVATLLSPLQDHVRRLFHQTDRSAYAAAVSAVQLATVVATIAILVLASVDDGWVPFGALALANALSLTVAFALARIDRSADRPYDLRRLLRFGSWLLYAYGVERAAAFCSLLILARVVGIEAVGEFEAARIFSQPVLVLAMGLLAALRPRAMRAAQQRDERSARHASTIFVASVAVVTVAYVLAVGPNWSWSPIVRFFPAAYSGEGLLAAMILATAATTTTLIFRSELVGGRREHAFAGLSTVMSALQLLIVVALAGSLGAMVLPLAIGVKAVASHIGLRWLLAGLYRPS